MKKVMVLVLALVLVVGMFSGCAEETKPIEKVEEESQEPTVIEPNEESTENPSESSEGSGESDNTSVQDTLLKLRIVAYQGMYADKLYILDDECRQIIEKAGCNKASYAEPIQFEPIENEHELEQKLSRYANQKCDVILISELEVSCFEKYQKMFSESGATFYYCFDTSRIDMLESNPMIKLETSKSLASRWGGTYLSRGNQLYSLTRCIPIETYERCVPVDGIDEWGWRRDSESAVLIYNQFFGGRILSFGDIPIPTLQNGDKIISYGNTSIKLMRVEFVGYSLPVCEDRDYILVIDNADMTLKRPVFNADSITQLQKTQIKEGPLLSKLVSIGDSYKATSCDDDYFDLDKNALYSFGWFKQTSYFEKYLYANCLCYELAGDDPIKLEGQLSRQSYAYYDLSDVPSGIYYVNSQMSIVETSGGLLRIE